MVLGRSRVSISELLELTKGSVIELDRKVGDPIDIMINDRMVARGDLVKVNGEFIGVALREIVRTLSPAIDPVRSLHVLMGLIIALTAGILAIQPQPKRTLAGSCVSSPAPSAAKTPEAKAQLRWLDA